VGTPKAGRRMAQLQQERPVSVLETSKNGIF
jgi:hypothetical protein